ncbi:pimeloyl-ACP methyl ester carboxylesterase [Micromonospora sp. Llam0]|uniref:alpha/beta fold hydrolase n=1 Tax=Micromonospora sp. Llam0 TaxID=2485143 RepID=UPI000F48DEF6|nr:alpha/beta hydrolase [Micromonospora sp. Llam0]ROO61060.1 pimeloyl-ACP methyl ester carboxylesterase [Micromonospora sp. Llam0]
MSPLLTPSPPGSPTPQPATRRVEVPAPPSWRVRAGTPSDTGWTITSLCWDRSVVPATQSPDRPPIVLVHGLGVAAGLCVPVAGRLAATGTVLAPDLPGCGRSSKPEPVPGVAELGTAVASWLPAVVTAPAVLVGVSLGCQVVLEAAVQAPDWVSAVVLASPTVDRGRRAWRSQLWRWQVEQTTQSGRLKRIQLTDYRRAGVGRVLRTFSAALADRPEDRIRRVGAPVLVCRGSRDPLVSDRWVADLRRQAPDGRLRRLPGVVHAMSHDNPLEFARVIHGFLDELATTGGGVDGARAHVPG